MLSEADPLPFSVEDEGQEASEELRLTYRYLDLRRPRRLRALELRARGRRGDAARARRRGLPRGRDAGPDPVDPRGRARLPGAEPPAARLVVRAAAEPPALQAAAHGRAAWSATTRSSAASATRTCAPTASPSSPSSTSRRRSSSRAELQELMERVLREAFAAGGVELELPFPRMSYAEADAPLRHRPARPALRDGDPGLERRRRPPRASASSRGRSPPGASCGASSCPARARGSAAGWATS